MQTKDDIFFSPRPSAASKNTNRRSKTPTPITVSRSILGSTISGRASTPTGFSNSPSFIKTPRNVTLGDASIMPSPKSPMSNPFGSPLSISSPTFIASTVSKSRKTSWETEIPGVFTRSGSRRPASTPIVFSQSMVRRKPPPIEKKLECSLEDLCYGGVKKIKLTRDIISTTGIVKEEETLKIRIKPGWKKGTKITFEGKGDEKPGFLPADVIFSIDEKRHHLFRRIGDDLEIGVEIPLVNALTGCSISVPLLGGATTNLTVSKVICPGYEEILPGFGMPISKEDGQRGNLRIKFLVKFPTKLRDEQRSLVHDILKDCC